MRDGLILHVVGPDGVGKSTLARELTAQLSPRHAVHHSYLRPGLIPLPGRLLGKPAPGLVTEPHGRPAHSHLRSLVRLLYYAADFIAGYWLIYRPILRRGGIILVERGWQDFVVDHRRYLTPSPTPARLLARLVPRPDVIVILDAPPSIVQQRKDELSSAEIVRQLDQWKASARARREVMVLDSERTPAELASEVSGHLGL